ncbi:hypothetical protein GGR56DRAFT_661016 [Xylariaceae sp. FL0804]|nr:hypothetical protein GGR56DRAFT_661016 [Xylariaceae sp. FL0804]
MSMATTTSTATIEEADARQRRPGQGRYGRYYDPVSEPDVGMRRIVAENCAMNAGAAAVLLQIASRGVGQGVSDHSSFTKRPVERARRSMFYIYVMAFGTPEERRVVSDATHRAHSRVKGADYDANDVDLQLWVAATMYWSLVLGYEEVYGPLDDDAADRVYREFSVYATGLRVPPEKWPKDRRAFGEYWDEALAGLEITDEARAVARDVLYPKKNVPWGIWIYAHLTGPFTRVATTELLPERARNEFGIPSTFYTRNLYWLMSAYNRTVYPMLPDSVRHFLKNHQMQDFRRRVAMQEGKSIIKL